MLHCCSVHIRSERRSPANGAQSLNARDALDPIFTKHLTLAYIESHASAHCDCFGVWISGLGHDHEPRPIFLVDRRFNRGRCPPGSLAVGRWPAHRMASSRFNSTYKACCASRSAMSQPWPADPTRNRRSDSRSLPPNDSMRLSRSARRHLGRLEPLRNVLRADQPASQLHFRQAPVGVRSRTWATRWRTCAGRTIPVLARR